MKLQGFYNYTEKERAIKQLEEERTDKDSIKAFYDGLKELNIMRFGE